MTSTKVAMDELVTGAEAARRLGFSRQRLGQLAEREDFPAPLGRVGQATVWRWSDLERWSQEREAARPAS